MNKQLAGNQGAEHFARVVPIVGTYLREKVVALVGTAQTAPLSMLAEFLAACGVRRWLVPQGSAADALEQRLAARHGTALALELVCGLAGPCAEGHTPDLVIAAGGPGELQSALAYADRSDCPALLICRYGGCGAAVYMPGRDCGALEWIASLPVGVSIHVQPERLDWDVVTVLPLLAGVARALLLRDTPCCREDLEAIWQAGLWQVHVPAQAPLQVAWQAGGPAPVVAETPFRSPAGGQGTVLVAGLGSIGSVAAAWLAHACERLVLVDPDHVDATNPVRQEFQIADVGLPKAEALAARLGGITPTVAYQQALRSEA
ncbi:MAG TPA: ThiF family adenylyltransferase, partial [Roseiflexaceae bacterium]|nr:ThiF family adenylyltransferase [Roseiflexaceae bacterium]